MPTKNPRVSFMLTQEQLDRVEDFQHTHRIKSTSKAIVHLLNLGIEELEKENDLVSDETPMSVEAPLDRLEAVIDNLTPEQARFLVTVVEALLSRNPDAYAAAKQENRTLWKD